jgi:ATP-grasp ribosomal peptide maturase
VPRGVVAILTRCFDPTADHVIEELNQRSVPVFRADLGDFPQNLKFSALLGDRGWSATLTTARRELNTADITGIYYRRPSRFAFPTAMSEPDRRWAHAEARMGLGGVLASEPGWLNHPVRIAACEYKPVQLGVAVQAGLTVPRTIVTSDPDAARQFAATVPQVIYKPLASAYVEQADGTRRVLYTSLADPADLADPAIRLTAHLFQERIEHDVAVRLTVVDDSFFACAIRPGSAAARIDWRADYSALSYSTTSVPRPVQSAVTALMAELGLRFGALDFLIRPDGEWVFLEVNANGQWAFVEDATGLAITSAIADALTGDST